MATPAQSLILSTLDREGRIADSTGLTLNGEPLTHADVQAACFSLASRNMITFEKLEHDVLELTDEGRMIAEQGSHEARVLEALASATAGLTIGELRSQLGPQAAVGQGNAFKLGWIRKEGDKLFAARERDAVTDKTREALLHVQATGACPDGKLLADLRKRKLLRVSKAFSFVIEKGAEFSLTVRQLETDLTIDMLQSGAWKEPGAFKPYNFDALGREPAGGALHPLMKVRSEFRAIFFEMGFKEMPTNRFVESSFWCFDALFVPQQHSARDLQDTFFTKEPASTDMLPEPAYVARVRAAHENGGDTGSIGYRYPWAEAEARKLVLRTHTTAVSAAMIYDIAQRPGGFRPAKMFSIDRVFRNEAVDATHLAEFHQIEGVIVDYGITLGDLIGFMETFFARLGVTNLRFKPAYNPYTEPSLEIFSYHAGLGKWVEVGNSGMFRPELLQPMGLPPDVRALGWGLSLERPTMIKYGVSDIRQLVGPKVNLDMIRNNAAVRLDKGSISA